MNEEVYIVAGGTSLNRFEFSKLEKKDVIAVNKSILSVPKAKYFVTMDHSLLKKLDLQRKILLKSPAIKIFIANLCPEYMEEKEGRFVDTRWNIIYKLNMFDVIIKSRAVEGFGMEYNDFRNGLNSGFCAVQLAVLLGYKNIYLLGYDFTAEGQTHYHGGYGESIEVFNKKLEQYFQILKKAILDFKKLDTGIKMYNCSVMSKLEDILTYKEI